MKAFEDEETEETVYEEEGTSWEDEEPEEVAVAAEGESPIDDQDDDEQPEVATETETTAADDDTPPGVTPSTRLVRMSDLIVEYRLWTNPRRFTGLDAASIADLAADISGKTTQGMGDDGEPVTYAGVDDPLHVVQISENGDVVNLVVDGQRRYRAVLKAYRSDPDVLVPVRDLEPAPVTWTQETSNKYLADSLKKVGLRAGLSAFELAKNAEFLRAQRDADTGKDYTLERIAGIIGRSESWVSKILSALRSSTPKLIHRWETGQITEEQFRDLAKQADPEEQEQAADAVVLARASGDSGAGRTLAKEQLELARASRTRPVPTTLPDDAEPAESSKPSKGSKGNKKKGPAVKGPQTEMPATPPRKPPPFAVVEDMIANAAKKPPTHEYVKGMLDGVRWATGLMDAALLGKPWQQYMQRCTGTEAAKPPAKGRTKGTKKRK